jgi:hypothetical protein
MDGAASLDWGQVALILSWSATATMVLVSILPAISQHFSFSRHFAIFRKIWRERTRFLLHHSLPAGHSQQSEDDLDLTEIVVPYLF